MTPDTQALKAMAVEWLCEQAEFDKEFAALLDARPCEECGGACSHPFNDWAEALALDLDGAVTDRLQEWLATLKEGRPPTQYVVEWEHRDLEDTSDIIDMLKEQGERRRAMGEEILEGQKRPWTKAIQL